MKTLRTHRIKEKNTDIVLSALKERNIDASVVEAPMSSDTYYNFYVPYPDDDYSWDTNGMVGIRCNLSGQKFHRLLVEIGVVAK